MAKRGRKTKYHEKYCDKLIEFFDVAHTVFETVTKYDKNGEKQETKVEKANKLPTFERFAVDIGVCVDTLNEWTRVHEEFSEAYKMAKNLQKDMINDLGMRGFYNPTYTIFVAKNITDMKDKVETELSGEVSAPQIIINREAVEVERNKL